MVNRRSISGIDGRRGRCWAERRNLELYVSSQSVADCVILAAIGGLISRSRIVVTVGLCSVFCDQQSSRSVHRLSSDPISGLIGRCPPITFIATAMSLLTSENGVFPVNICSTSKCPHVVAVQVDEPHSTHKQRHKHPIQNDSGDHPTAVQALDTVEFPPDV
jgi:hypothetical protein